VEQGRYRTRSILIATRAGRRVFASPEEIPSDLRRPLEKALEGELTTTILIADENGRAEALRRLREGLERRQKRSFPYAREAALAGVGAFLVWLLATLR
jgi:hypothetical protein